MSFTEITGPEYTDLLLKRLQGKEPELTWLRQFRDILRPNLHPGVTILDVGCAVGYAYNSFKEFDVVYTGLDIEQEYLNIAAQWFSDIHKSHFIHHDINVAPLPISTDIVICSAILEHCTGLMPALQHLVDGVSKVLMLRTFLGDVEHIYSKPSVVPEYTDTYQKYSNQYAFKDVLGHIESRGFKTRVYRDAYTDSMPQFIEGDGVVRTFYVVHAERRMT